MKPLRTLLHQYVALRRGLGCKFRHQEKRLNGFVQFMESQEASVITHKLAFAWAMQSPEHRPSCSLRLTDVRGFARYVSLSEPSTEIPPVRALPGPVRSKPYLYTEQEIAQLLAAALALPPRNGLRRWSFHCLFGLLAVTGLRISEALALRNEDVNLKTGLLTIRGTKFGKSRSVAIHPTATHVLLQYAKRRDRQFPVPCSPYFLVAERGGPLVAQRVYPVFHQLSRQIGLRPPNAHTGPRLHDFRHRFAVETLVKGGRAGEDIECLLPVLSTYLGHTSVRDTYWYLSACPALFGEAVKKLEHYWGGQP